MDDISSYLHWTQTDRIVKQTMKFLETYCTDEDLEVAKAAYGVIAMLSKSA